MTIRSQYNIFKKVHNFDYEMHSAASDAEVL